MLRDVDVSGFADAVSVSGLSLSGLCTALCERQIRPEGYSKILWAVGTNDVHCYKAEGMKYYREARTVIDLLKFLNDSCRICILGVLPRLKDVDRSAVWVETANKAFNQVALDCQCAYYPSQQHFYEKDILKLSLFKKMDKLHLSPSGVHRMEQLLLMIYKSF